MVQWKQMHQEADALLQELNADFDSYELMGNLSVAQQQMVEIAKALSLKARIIIMDEPTAALTKRESEELYRITRKLRDEGKSIIFISHRFEDMYALASRVTVRPLQPRHPFPKAFSSSLQGGGGLHYLW